jgi:hypothetical protein
MKLFFCVRCVFLCGVQLLHILDSPLGHVWRQKNLSNQIELHTYSNTVRVRLCFISGGREQSAELRTCIPFLLPHPNSYSRNIAYLVSSCKQETVIAADRNRQSGSNGGGDGDGNGDGDSGKEDDRGDGGGGDSNGDCDSGGGDDENNGGNSASGGAQTTINKIKKMWRQRRWRRCDGEDDGDGVGGGQQQRQL